MKFCTVKCLRSSPFPPPHQDAVNAFLKQRQCLMLGPCTSASWLSVDADKRQIRSHDLQSHLEPFDSRTLTAYDSIFRGEWGREKGGGGRGKSIGPENREGDSVQSDFSKSETDVGKNNGFRLCS